MEKYNKNFFLLVCGLTSIINQTKEWNSYDQKALKRAKIGCHKYYKDNPCLKKFYKIENFRYAALCGVRK
jgi:hypothetical protein